MNNGQMIQGLTLRDYFAANAMCGLASTALIPNFMELRRKEGSPTPERDACGQVASMAYAVADAMLAFRTGGPDVGGPTPTES